MSKSHAVKKPRLTWFTVAQIMTTLSALFLLSGCGAASPNQTIHATSTDLAFPGNVDAATASVTSDLQPAVDRLSGNYYGEMERQIQGSGWVRTPYNLRLGRRNVQLPTGQVAAYAEMVLDIAATGSLPAVHVESLMATQSGYQYGPSGMTEQALSFTSKVMGVREISDMNTFIQVVLPFNGITSPTQAQIRIYGCGLTQVGYCMSNSLAPDVRFITALIKR